MIGEVRPTSSASLEQLIARMDDAAIFYGGDDCAGSLLWGELKAALQKPPATSPVKYSLDLTDPRGSGKRAFEAGLSVDNNPYRPPFQRDEISNPRTDRYTSRMVACEMDSPDWREWDAGWREAALAIAQPQNPSPGSHVVGSDTLSDAILRELENHDRCPPEARDRSRRIGTARLIMQHVHAAKQEGK